MHVDPKHPHGRPPESLPDIEPPIKSRICDRAGINIVQCDLNKKSDRKKFISVTDNLYTRDPHFVTPLRHERMRFLDPTGNKSLRHFEINALLAYQENRLVGRITAHIDHAYNRYHGTDKTGWFGFFECIDDRRTAHALLAESTNWLRAKGCKEVIGPMNFSTNHQCGLLVENFERPPVIEMTYNPPYYEELLTSFGMGKAKDLYSWTIDVNEGLNNAKVARIAKIADRVRQRTGVSVRQADLSKFDEEVKTLFSSYNRAWQKNWGFVPVGEDEFTRIAADLKPILRKELVLFVEVNAKPVGFSVTLPDINQVLPKNGRLFPLGWFKLLTQMKKIDFARLMVLGIEPEYRKRGLETLLFIETMINTQKLGMKGGELGWTLEDNDLINNAIRQMDGRLDRKYRLFGGNL